jgi:hypothetical protein
MTDVINMWPRPVDLDEVVDKDSTDDKTDLAKQMEINAEKKKLLAARMLLENQKVMRAYQIRPTGKGKR